MKTKQKIVVCDLPDRGSRLLLISLGDRWSEKDFIAEAARRLVKEKVLGVEDLSRVRYQTRDTDEDGWDLS